MFNCLPNTYPHTHGQVHSLARKSFEAVTENQNWSKHREETEVLSPKWGICNMTSPSKPENIEDVVGGRKMVIAREP